LIPAPLLGTNCANSTKQNAPKIETRPHISHISKAVYTEFTSDKIPAGVTKIPLPANKN
jgi:hypothetical protein